MSAAENLALSYRKAINGRCIRPSQTERGTVTNSRRYRACWRCFLVPSRSPLAALAATVGMAARMMLPARRPPNDSMTRVANLNALTFPAPNIDPKVLFTTSMPAPHNCPAS